MGFMGSLLSPNIQIQVYDLNFEQIAVVELSIKDNMVNQMALCHNEKYLVCTHKEGMITIVNTEDMS